MSVLDGWRICPRCGAQLARGEGRVECAACGFVTYANPAPTACALCVDDRGRLLLGRRADEPFRGLWDIPGGFLDEDEHPLDCLRRELREESGFEVEPGEFVGAWMDRYGPREDVPAGAAVVQEGEDGDRFYVVLSGVLATSQKSLGPRGLLRPGDTFGEVALAMGVPRTASVRAMTPVTVASCDQATFDEFLRPLFAED